MSWRNTLASKMSTHGFDRSAILFIIKEISGFGKLPQTWNKLGDARVLQECETARSPNGAYLAATSASRSASWSHAFLSLLSHRAGSV